MSVAAIHAAPAKMVGEPWSFGAAHEIFQAAEVFAIGFFSGAEVHGHAMLDDFIAFEDLVEDLKRTAAVDHEIFGNDFEPIDTWVCG